MSDCGFLCPGTHPRTVCEFRLRGRRKVLHLLLYIKISKTQSKAEVSIINSTLNLVALLLSVCSEHLPPWDAQKLLRQHLLEMKTVWDSCTGVWEAGGGIRVTQAVNQSRVVFLFPHDFSGLAFILGWGSVALICQESLVIMIGLQPAGLLKSSRAVLWSQQWQLWPFTQPPMLPPKLFPWPLALRCLQFGTAAMALHVHISQHKHLTRLQHHLWVS